MNGFTKKSIGTLTLGEKLKKFRSDRRMSLGDVSRSTNIQVKYLEFIEEGEYEKLPADVYVKGFLKSYAEFLGIDENVLIKMFEKEKEIKKNLKLSKSKKEKGKNNFKLLKPLKIHSFIFTPKIIIGTLITLVVIAGLVYLYKEIGSFASMPRLIILSPEQNSVIQGNSVLVDGITDRDAQLFINGQAVLVNDEGNFRENLILQPGSNTISVKAINRFKKELEEIITLQAVFQENSNAESNMATEQANNTEEKKDDLNPEGVKLEIRIDPGPVQISVEADGNLIFSGTMLTGGIQSFTAKEKIVIDSGKANSTFVKFNGKEIGALGDKAMAIKSVTFTKDMKY
jgi:transcriptional regulator with XRE-family HTH domain